MINCHGRRIPRTAVALGILFASVFSSVSMPAAGAATSPQDLAGLIYHGQFDRARKSLTTQPTVVANRPADPLAPQLDKMSSLSQVREKNRTESYNDYVKEAKDFFAKAQAGPTASAPATKPVTAKGKASTAPATEDSDTPKTNIEKALTGARKAKFYAADPKTFGQAAWVRQIADKAKVQAQAYLDKHEWLRAANIYAELATIYEDDKTYDKLTRDCAMRVRFEATYKPKTDWKDEIKNIKADVIPELSSNVANFYVEKADFGKMAVTGLQSIAMITEIPKLTKVFPSLSDAKKTREFDQELKTLIAQVKSENAQKPLSTLEFYRAFIKLLVINSDTIDLPQEMIIKEFTDSALSELDPFTNLIWPSEVEDFDKHTTGRFSGVGIQLSMENGKLKVITPIPGTPAYHAGIVPGDTIVSIDGESTDGITIDQAVRKITGQKGTQVTLGILHPWTEKARQVPMVRDTIIIQTIKGFRMDKNNEWQYMMDAPNEKLAYIRVTSFTDTTVSELEDALKQVRKHGAQGLVLDLRFNPGGTLKAAVEMADLFIPKGVLVSTKGRSVDPWERSADPGEKYTDLPMVVLINGFSASAAEIVSGALKDYHRAWLIGERSFGKGSVQNVLELPSGLSRLKMTTAYYYLPKGKCIHKKPDSKEWGVDPDLKIELTPDELRDVIDIERDAEIVTQVNGMKVSSMPATKAAAKPKTAPATESAADEVEEEGVKLPTTRKHPPEDIQLQAAAAVLQARLDLKVPWDQVGTKTNPAPAKIVAETSN